MLPENIQDYFYLRLGELIKEARNKVDVKQEKLAEFLGLSRVSIVNIEQGKQKVQIHTLLEIINYLEIPITDFFGKLNNAINLDVDAKLE
ncbi:MAG: hypothetical protein JWQ38_2103, partial [Flavipsychrobacter sp.]|nr:hypothetical protein [Flavipsychrobacter sp.]